MQISYAPPKYNAEAFSCPFCNAYAAMTWHNLLASSQLLHMRVAVCHRCDRYSTWKYYSREWKMVDPQVRFAPPPSDDLPTNCREIYLEAREIAESSPRGAAALLRLCIQSLCVDLGGEGKNLNNDIAALVREGLPVRVQQALDAVRVVGNNAVHPGEIDVNDERDTVLALFALINMIVENQITQPKHVSAIFEALPTGAKEAVERRDGKGEA